MLVLGSAFPNQLSKLIAYQLLIVKNSIKFEYPFWLRYDIDFRQWAVSTWSQIHPQFYAFAFTAQGKATDWCPICHTDGGNHTYDCPKFSTHSAPLFALHFIYPLQHPAHRNLTSQNHPCPKDPAQIIAFYITRMTATAHTGTGA